MRGSNPQARFDIQGSYGERAISLLKRECDARGATLVVAGPLFVRGVLPEEILQSRFSQLQGFLRSLDIPLLPEPPGYVVEPELGFDTYYHLNSKGAAVVSARIAHDLRNYLR